MSKKLHYTNSGSSTNTPSSNGWTCTPSTSGNSGVCLQNSSDTSFSYICSGQKSTGWSRCQIDTPVVGNINTAGQSSAHHISHSSSHYSHMPFYQHSSVRTVTHFTPPLSSQHERKLHAIIAKDHERDIQIKMHSNLVQELLKLNLALGLLFDDAFAISSKKHSDLTTGTLSLSSLKAELAEKRTLVEKLPKQVIQTPVHIDSISTELEEPLLIPEPPHTQLTKPSSIEISSPVTLSFTPSLFPIAEPIQLRSTEELMDRSYLTQESRFGRVGDFSLRGSRMHQEFSPEPRPSLHARMTQYQDKLTTSSLTKLSINETLLSIIQENPNAPKLDFSDNCISDSNITCITSSISFKLPASVVFINFADNSIGDPGAKTIADALASGELSSLKGLDFHGNKLTGVGYTYFTEALESPKTQDIVITLELHTEQRTAWEFVKHAFSYIAEAYSKKQVIADKELLVALYGEGEYAVCKKALADASHGIAVGMVKTMANPVVAKTVQVANKIPHKYAKVAATTGVFVYGFKDAVVDGKIFTPELLECIALFNTNRATQAVDVTGAPSDFDIEGHSDCIIF